MPSAAAPAVTVTPAGPAPPALLDDAALWKAISSPARRASVADGAQEALAALAAAQALSPDQAAASPDGLLQPRAFRSRAASTPNHQLTPDQIHMPAPLHPLHLSGSPSGAKPAWGSAPAARQWPAGQQSAAAAAAATQASIWNTPQSTLASLSAEKAFLEADLPSRQYRSLSFAVPGSSDHQAAEAFRARFQDAPLPEAVEAGDMTEEEFAAMPKSRSRSKSSSAIYTVDEFGGPSPAALAAAQAAAQMHMLQQMHLHHHQQQQPQQPQQQQQQQQMADISSIWRDSARTPELLHRRASTQPSHQMFVWEALRSSNLATPADMNGDNTEDLLERFRQQQAAQMRRFSVAPSVVTRFISSNVDQPEQPPPGEFDPTSRRRHSLAVTTLDRKLNMRFLAEGFSALGINDQIEEIDDYFENTESRVRAWAEAGKNLQMNQTPASPISAISPAARPVLRFPIYVVEFKAGRIDYFYLADDFVGSVSVGDLAIVEADRGKDLGKVIETNINSLPDLQLYQATHADGLIDSHMANREITPKRLFRLAQPQEVALLLTKGQDEAKAMGVCQVKIRQRKLPMEIVDAEYQWDRRKLTFYFVAERRVDFRELVRELFKIYKTRIWMCAVNPMRIE
ncbi:hypothetical protein HK105_203354 [Polyrhizophydium stewartii]|uniref:PSP1 C-terminal domain-containing protein n=1 Tax=Polyrhizophydium stewartii TaxID=2732419 RepID=A0ABR4NBR5_9FUNG